MLETGAFVAFVAVSTQKPTYFLCREYSFQVQGDHASSYQAPVFSRREVANPRRYHTAEAVLVCRAAAILAELLCSNLTLQVKRQKPGFRPSG